MVFAGNMRTHILVAVMMGKPNKSIIILPSTSLNYFVFVIIFSSFEKTPDASEIGFSCEDIDECSITEPCDRSAECVNTVGSFTCYCPDGYVGDGYSCGSKFCSCKNSFINNCVY